MVRIAGSGARGRLAFYVDGEPKPRIESDAVGLADAVPSLPGHRSPVLNNPVLTLLPFRKSVKVGLRDASECLSVRRTFFAIGWRHTQRPSFFLGIGWYCQPGYRADG